MTETIWARQALLPRGWAENVVIEVDAKGVIQRVQAGISHKGHKRHGCILPAPVNLHSHGFQRGFAGRAERRGPGADSFWTWRETMYRFVAVLTPDDVQAITAMAFVEMAEAGFAAVCEFHYLHHGPGGVPYDDPCEMAQRVIHAAGTAGIGLCLLPVLYMQGGCDGRALAGGQLRFGNDRKGFGDILARMPGMMRDNRLGIAVHSLRAVTPAALAWAAQLAPRAPFHIHMAEQEAEVAEVQAALGARPVEWLLANHKVDGRWCLVHATQMTPEETRALAATGAVAGLCPVTEANLGDGAFDGAGWRAAGGGYGIGTDSNVAVSVHEELRMLDYSQRLKGRARGVMADPGGSPGRALYDAVLVGGAQAAQRRTGQIARGWLADLVALDMGDLALEQAQGDEILDAWIFAARRPLVREVWAAGRHIVQGGRHIARDGVEGIYRSTMFRLRDRL